ncbi:MAG: hypothetical protein NTX49_06615 [Chlamydiae bacterium]|nr:hypothetical protein [Chlamydiota bacterium]
MHGIVAGSMKMLLSFHLFSQKRCAIDSAWIWVCKTRACRAFFEEKNLTDAMIS